MSTVLHALCFSVVQASHLPQRASRCRSPEREAGAALSWQCHDIWLPAQFEVAERETSQAGGKRGGRRHGLCQGGSGSVLPRRTLRVRQQQHAGGQVHLRLRQRWVVAGDGNSCVCVCPLSIKWTQSSLLSFFSSDPQNVFQRNIVNVLLARAGENCTIPCVVTDPGVTHMALETCDGQPLPPAMSYHGNPQRGIVISDMRKEYEGCYKCVGQLDGNKVTSMKYNVDVRLGK